MCVCGGGGGGGSEQKIKAFLLLPIPSFAGTHWHMDERRRHERLAPHAHGAKHHLQRLGRSRRSATQLRFVSFYWTWNIRYSVLNC